MKNWIIKIFRRFFLENILPKELHDEIHFQEIIIREKTPKLNQLNDGEFIEVIYRRKSYWVIFMCPCGCGNIISLTLQNSHNPYWNLTHSIYGRPTVYPSIWQNTGCLSHFWIKDGKIIWCDNSGIEPWIAEPEYYKKPMK